MKKQIVDKKITFSKETVSNLNSEDMRKFLGGATIQCPSINCESIIQACG